MNIKKGFTLIELLAVIIILGLLVLISTPKLRNIINDSKSKVREQDVQLFLRALGNEIYAKNLKGKFDPKSCIVEDSIVTCDGTNIDMKKSKNNINGVVYIENNEIKNYDLTIGKVQYTNIEYTDERCFDIRLENGYADSYTVYDYYDYIDNDSNNDTCPRDVVIPKKITIIENRAFYQKQLTSVFITRGITKIGVLAFANNNLQNINIPDSVTSIENSAFYNNQLTSVKIPDSVTYIGDYSFSRNQLTEVDISNNVTNILLHSFSYNRLTSIIIPDSVTSIGENAFRFNNLKTVEIGRSNSMLENVSSTFAFSNADSDGYGPNEVTYVRIHKEKNSIDLTQSGLDISEIQWNE